ncbi:MBL fold metallo-hydrolase [Agrococcus sp. Marseille-P2731]|uniref:MBL fold metallo-hydrolase n=1 Tax=Agrococcus sp. Marseille-P2731 TaxID=1841862 RepID=UPI0009FA530B|nr:MBL fold metallo-hydrolase [Agrococcus sp. Marseille-P2731]
MAHDPALRSSSFRGARLALHRRRQARLDRDVVPGVHRLRHASTNAYLLEEGGSVTLVDALFPGSLRHLHLALDAIGRSITDVRALVLTHAHFDHLGMARELERQGVPLWLHPADAPIAAHPYRYRPARPRLVYPFRYPAAISIMAAMTSVGALQVRGVGAHRALEDGALLDVPGSPRVIATPGHTDGHVALLLEGRDALLSGDALVTLDPYTAKTGPRVVAAAATNDPSRALASLDVLAATGAGTVLPGHGEPWRGGIEAAVQAARSAGVD